MLVSKLPIYPTYSIPSPLVSVGCENALFPRTTRPVTQEDKNLKIINSKIANSRFIQ